jgi:hypothetical protein
MRFGSPELSFTNATFVDIGSARNEPRFHVDVRRSRVVIDTNGNLSGKVDQRIAFEELVWSERPIGDRDKYRLAPIALDISAPKPRYTGLVWTILGFVDNRSAYQRPSLGI